MPTPVHCVDPGKTRLVIVGVGGTGGYVLQQVARLVYGLPEHTRPPIVLVDGDKVEEKNLLRQYFLPQDVGRNKAQALAERYGRAYGIDIRYRADYVTAYSPLGRGEEGCAPEGSIVVGCVDNAETRSVLHDDLEPYDHVVYIDSGNGGITLPDDPDHLDRYQLAKIRDSGWEGQVVAGLNYGGYKVLPFPGEVFPDLFVVEEEQDRHPERCSEMMVSNPQRLMTNNMAATVVMMYLHTLLGEGMLVHHISYFDARSGYLRSVPAIEAMLQVSP